MLRQQRGREGRELGGVAQLSFYFNPFVHWVLVSPVVEVLVPMESGRFPHLIPAASQLLGTAPICVVQPASPGGNLVREEASLVECPLLWVAKPVPCNTNSGGGQRL